MKRTLSLIIMVMMLATLVAGCGGAPAQQPSGGGGATEATEAPADTEAGEGEEAAPSGESTTTIVGYSASLTGKLEVESKRQNDGFSLWLEQVNSNGGVTLADGSTTTFEPKFYDDESSTERVQELYTRLSTEDNADFLISPYSSGLTEASAIIAEQNGKVMITTGAASDGTYQKGFSLIYQAYTPASRYLTGAVDMLEATDPEAKKIAIVYENAKFSTSVVEALRTYAEEKGYEVVLYEGYDSATADFAPFINKIQQSAPEAIMGGGHFQDGSTFAKQLKEKGVPVKFMALLVAPPEPSFSEIGEAALGVIGPSQWEPLAAFTEEAAGEMGVEWYGPTGEEFLAAYEEAYGEEPSYHATGGYMSGLILQKAIEDAGSTDTEAVKAALDAMDILTFYGHIKFDTSEESHGLQVGHDMVYIQWQEGEDGSLEKQVVWPPSGATSDPLYPIP